VDRVAIAAAVRDREDLQDSVVAREDRAEAPVVPADRVVGGNAVVRVQASP
jgi:hypothetical protein